jgi:hypothetical protein
MAGTFTIGLEVQMGDSLVREIQHMEQALPAQLARALHNEANQTMAEAKLITPVGQYSVGSKKVGGTLRDSGFVDEPQISGTTIEVPLGFGGAAEAYALVQHEHTEYHHDVGEAKFLEKPMLQHASGLAERLAADMRGVG